MKILLLGGSGMIGQYMKNALEVAGHTVLSASRHSKAFPLDLNHVPNAPQLEHSLQGFDGICNCIGIGPGMSHDEHWQVHYHALLPILQAAINVKIHTWVQISALSNALGEDLNIPYLASKYAFDAELLASGLQVAIMRPSVVYSKKGASTKMFLNMGLLPILPLPQKGRMPMQPVHVDDLCAAVVNWLKAAHTENQIYHLGGRLTTLAGYLQALRPKVPRVILTSPDAIARLGMKVLHGIQPAVGGINAYKLLLAGSSTDSGDLETLLGRKPMDIVDFRGHS